jgi:hypothetical protein
VNSQSTDFGKRLVYDMIQWAKDPNNVVEAGPGEAVTIPVEVSNGGGIDAASVRFVLRRPYDKTIVSTTEVAVSLPAGTVAQVEYAATAPSSPLGEADSPVDFFAN